MLCVVKTTRNEAYFILSYTGAISEKMRKISIIDTSLKITNYRLHPHLPMAKKRQDIEAEWRMYASVN